ncbi:MAG: response regulator, partial [bacterium]
RGQPHEDSTERPAPGGRVLVVDDDPQIRRIVRRVLEGDGFEHAEAADGREALAALRAGAFDLVIADHDLGRGMTGTDLLTVVRNLWSGIARVMLASAPPDDAADVAHVVLTKPCDPGELREAVRAAVDAQREGGR